MKAAMLHGPRDFRVEDVDDPKLEPDGIIIRVKACAICGGDLPAYERGKAPEGPGQPGHEVSGEVVEVGANVTHLKPGMRLAVGAEGGYAEYMAIKGGLLLPDDMSYEIGATVEPLGVSMALVTKAEPAAGDTVAVFGAGAIGQGAWQIFRALGASKVIVVEVAKKRLEIAKAQGADVVINAAEEDPVEKINEVTSGKGADIVAICCTSADAFKQAFEAVRGGPLYQMMFRGKQPAAGTNMMSVGGKVVMVAGPREAAEWGPVRTVIQKALTIRGSWGGLMREAFDLMKAGKVDTAPWITHQFSLDKINEAFETALRRDEAVKVMVKP